MTEILNDLNQSMLYATSVDELDYKRQHVEQFQFSFHFKYIHGKTTLAV